MNNPEPTAGQTLARRRWQRYRIALVIEKIADLYARGEMDDDARQEIRDAIDKPAKAPA